jgi:uncharacterized protein (DUF1778 family)
MKKEPADKKANIVFIRATQEEKAVIVELAKKEGRSISNFILWLVKLFQK